MIERLAIDGDHWASFVNAAPAATPFHHPAWASTIARSYGLEAFVLGLVESEKGVDACTAGIPVIEVRTPLRRRRRWVSLPFTDHCPALVPPDRADRFGAAVEALRLESDIVQVEVVGGIPGLPSVASGSQVQHVLPLDADPLVVEQRFRAAVRRNIRAARSSGLTLRRSAEERDVVDVFYGLHVKTRRRLGIPPQPRRFFRALWEGIIAPGLGHVAVVESGGATVAAAVLLEWNRSVVYKYGASDPAAWSLRPNNLLFADEIASACVRGNHTFHFGRTDVVDEGLRRFKLGWGAEEAPVLVSCFGEQRAEREGPPELLRALVRRSPPFVVRSLGEALYRFVA